MAYVFIFVSMIRFRQITEVFISIFIKNDIFIWFNSNGIMTRFNAFNFEFGMSPSMKLEERLLKFILVRHSGLFYHQCLISCAFLIFFVEEIKSHQLQHIFKEVYNECIQFWGIFILQFKFHYFCNLWATRCHSNSAL